MRGLIRFFVGIVLNCMLGSLACAGSYTMEDSTNLTILILNRNTSEHMAAWLTISTAEDDNIHGWYSQRGRKGFPAVSPFSLTVPQGQLTIASWNNVVSVSREVFTVHGPSDTIKLYLEPWVDLHEIGYYSFDSHNHLNGYDSLNRPPYLQRYAAAMGIDHLDLGQGWLFGIRMPVTYDSLIHYFEEHSTDKLSLRFGAETPKLRYGHTWYVNHPGLKDPFGEYLDWHDVAFVDTMKSSYTRQKGYVDLRGELRPPWHPPFVDRLRYKAEGAFSVIAHPTRWWNDGEDQIFPVPNLVADLSFDLLAAGSYDGITVVGDNKDNIFYQNLWFNLLNQGYRLVPCGETDGNAARGNLGASILTYAYTGEKTFNFNQFLQALKAGHTSVSGKAMMLLDVDGVHPPGSEFEANGSKHQINVNVFSEPSEEEFVSFLLLFRNGELIEKVDFRDQKSKSVQHTFKVEETETAWYVVKSYGKNYPQEELQFDVMAYVAKCMENSSRDYTRNTGISLTAPVFFNGPDWTPPALMISDITMEFTHPDGSPLSHFMVEVWNVDERIGKFQTDAQGRIKIQAPATIDIRYEDGSGNTHQKWLFYEYPPVLDIMESIYTLSYLKKYPAALPGQIPWEMFQLKEMKNVLKRINWQIAIEK